MSEWKEIFIDSACSRLSSGKSISSSLIKDKGDYPVYGGNGIRGFTNTYNFDGECAIIGRQGASCGNVRYFSGKAYMTEHAVVAVPTKEHNAYYLSCVLASLKLGRLSGQSAQPGIGVGLIGKQNIIMPSLATQQKIASILSSLDSKIENNRKICANLEAQAQALFKHWFIDFAPFKDGKFVESELGMIPEGWRVGSPYEYLDFIYGAPYKSNLFNDKKEGLPLIRIRDLKDCSPQFYTPEVLPKSEYVKAGDILAGMDAEFAPYIWKGQQGLLNQRVCKIKPKSKEIGRFFCMLLVKPQLLFVQAVKTGTTVSHIGKSDIDRFKVILPPLNEVIRFSKLGEEILDEIITVSAESSRLSTLRDTLLPKLMSGEIKV